jgi:UDP-N-acetylglucosamine transferase subunit ALG13
VIFVSVGTQLAFDRMIAAVDQWAGSRPHAHVFAQVGPTALEPQHIEYRRFLSPGECRERMDEAKAIVAHAGMGTILAALELGKPLVVMPRRAALGEQRNDHQLATARRLAELGRLAVAGDESELPARLDELEGLVPHEPISPYASPDFIASLRRFIEGGPEVPADTSAR